ncbi:MAG: acyltransferase, partial [Bacteroidota bacterium]
MFGTYRTILALFVMIGHLFGPYQLGIYSVFGFYTLSGYLMTLVMQTSYGYTADGFRRFLFNRFLRIYPSYYAAIGFSVLLLLIFKEEVTQFKQNIFLPSKLEEYFHNLLIIFPRDTLLRLSPASWALTIEIFFYMCICFGLSRNKQRSIVWFVISLVITVYLLIFSKSWQDRYYTIAAASLPFSIGALIYHNCSCFKKVLEVLRIKSPIFWLVLMVFNFT